jgi:hypothetical protein
VDIVRMAKRTADEVMFVAGTRRAPERATLDM